MKVYFSSKVPCLLRIGGETATCGRHPLCADLPENEVTLAEFFPFDGGLMPAAAPIGRDTAPPFCDVALFNGGMCVHAARFCGARRGMRVLAQEREGRAMLTLYRDGELHLAAEDKDTFGVLALPAETEDASLGRLRFAGRTLLYAESRAGKKKRLTLFDGASPLFDGEVLGFAGGNELVTQRPLYDIPGHVAESTWTAEGGGLRLLRSEVREREGFDPAALPERLRPFAFFQTVLARGDPAKYLTPALAERTKEIAGYLGDFCRVCLPPPACYRAYGEENHVALAYRERKNLFRLRLFSAPLEDGKIANLLPSDEN